MRENRSKKRRDERRGARERSREAAHFEGIHHALGMRMEAARARSPATERRYDEKHKHIGFNALEERVYREYLAKGYSKKTAREWARATAGKVWHQQHAMGLH